MTIVETIVWRKYSIDLNTGSEIEYFNMAVELTAQHCAKICNTVQENFEISPRLKPVAVQITDSCAAKITESFLK